MSGFRDNAYDVSDYMVGSLDYDYEYSDHSGNDRHSDSGGYGSHSGSGYGGGKEECCPLVVDALCLAAILGAIAGASILLARVLQIELTGRRKKRFAESEGGLWQPVLDGKQAATIALLPPIPVCHCLFLFPFQSNGQCWKAEENIFAVSRSGLNASKKNYGRNQRLHVALQCLA